ELLDQATTFLVLPAAARLMLALAPPGLGALIVGFAAFVLADSLRGSLLAVPDVERLWLIAELLLAAACLAVFAFGRSDRVNRWRSALHVPRVRQVAMVALAACLVGLVAAVAGWMELARLLGSAVLSTIALGVVFRLVARIAQGAVGVVLRVPPVGALAAVQHERGLIEERARLAIDWLAFAAWAFAVLRNLAVGHLALEAARGLLETRIGPGDMSVSIGDLAAFGLTIWGATLLSRLLRFVLEEEVYPRWGLARGIPFAISTVLHYALVGGGFVLALGALGLDLNRFTVLAGAFGVGIGFGLQNIVNNFVSGLILLFERPIQVGDEVQLGELVGEVRDIGVRSSTVRTPRGADVIVPNGSLISERVTNWTRPDRLRRIDIVVSTRYGADPEKVLGLLREVARTHPAVLADPPPSALLTRFAENTVWFELRAWTNRLEQVATVSSDLHLRVYRELEEAGVLPA
ncbi:MAG: mechanosensitive ion channel family protein, partial [Alphaproteobacteria bacterium]